MLRRPVQLRQETAPGRMAGSVLGHAHLFAWGMVFAAMALMQVGRAEEAQTSRDDVQAAYLYNFGKFVRWPQPDQGPMLLCIAGTDPFGQAVGKLVAGEEIGGRRVEERDLASPEGVGACSILFVGTGARGREESYLTAAEGKPILTVGEGPDFLERGGMIEFVLVGDHVRFAVNLEAVNRHGIALSSELLKVAVAVTGNPGAGGAK